MKTQFAVFDKNFNSVILGMYDTKEESQTDREKYGYNTEDYYVADAEEYMNNLIKRTKKVPYNNYASYTHIPESIAKQPIDPNADYSEMGNVALDLVKKVFAKLNDNKKELISDTESRDENNNEDHPNYICHSGGCPGADMAWETQGYKYNVHTISYSFHNHKQEGKNQKILLPKELQEGYEAAKIADKTLNRNFDAIIYPYVKNLLARNWFQVKNADAVYAISKKFLSNSIVDGGTGWAVQMAIDSNKPVYVFDQPSKKWYLYSTTNREFDALPSVAPVLTRNFAGIGTRELTDDGLQAIVNTYKRVKK